MNPTLTAASAQQELVALLDVKQVDRAAAHYSASIASGLALPYPSRLIADLNAQGATEAALRLAQSAPFVGQTAPWQVLTRVQSLERLGAYALAFTVAEAGVAQFPQAGNLRVALARCAFLSGQPTAITVAACQAAAKAQPEQAGMMGQVAALLQTGSVVAMGFQLALPPQAVSPKVALAILSGGYEAIERRAAIQGLRSTDRVLELGSGVGLVALSLDRAQPGIPILTVEANPHLHDVIRTNFAANGCRAELIGAVAALGEGDVDFHLADDFWGSSIQGATATSHSVRLPTVDVNKLIARFQPTLLVMDIEGSELDLLPLLALDGLRRLVIEFHPTDTNAAAISACLAHLLEQGFRLDLGAGSRQVLVFDRPTLS